MDDRDLIKISGLTFKRQDKVIFDGIDLRIARGKVTAIMGPSGTGKTTLLRLIGAELTPDSGNVLLNDRDIHSLSAADLFQARQQMGLLFQSSALFNNLSVFDNVAFPLREHSRLSEALIRDIVLMKLQAVGLRGAQHLMPEQLSGGMARRVALARAIALDPELIKADCVSSISLP